MGLDASFRTVLRPVDGRGLRGVYSRGKPTYPGLSNSPNPGNLQAIAKKRLMNGFSSQSAVAKRAAAQARGR